MFLSHCKRATYLWKKYVQSWWCFSLTFINIHKFNLILPKPSNRQVVAIEFFSVCLYCLNLLHVFILSNLSFIFQYSCELSSNIGKNASTSGQPENSGCREDLWSCRRLIVQTINTLGMTKTNISRIFSKGDCHKLYFNLKKSECLYIYGGFPVILPFSINLKSVFMYIMRGSRGKGCKFKFL